MLVRSLVYATREDLLPEFRDYHARLAGWGRAMRQPAPHSKLPRCVGTIAEIGDGCRSPHWGTRYPPEAIFAVLVEAAAWILLHVDERLLASVDAALADNIGWLDFTHMLTFADAAVTATRRLPALWPAALLQLACFIGRNAGYVDPGLDDAAYAVADIAAVHRRTQKRGLFDHGRDRFIISVHLTKTLLATATLMESLPAQGAAACRRR